jgi:hypothetical protein
VSSGPACGSPGHFKHWRVFQRNCNHSAFNGYHKTPSTYSSLACFGNDDGTVHRVWRTKAKYVSYVPDISPEEFKDWRVYPVKG